MFPMCTINYHSSCSVIISKRAVAENGLLTQGALFMSHRRQLGPSIAVESPMLSVVGDTPFGFKDVKRMQCFTVQLFPCTDVAKIRPSNRFYVIQRSLVILAIVLHHHCTDIPPHPFRFQ